ncbi:MerR family transcriptional regulator [Geotalea daltonii]|uniref:MerR family transcriptional regulator n=1 Tax=Geotalea daltonii TaxID=1203471 RepID=UPI0000DCC926
MLRFWETAFTDLNPKKSKSGQRLYSKEDLEVVKQIKQLLYNEKLTIDGARKRLGERINNLEAMGDENSRQVERLKQIIQHAVAQLQDLRNTM